MREAILRKILTPAFEASALASELAELLYNHTSSSSDNGAEFSEDEIREARSMITSINSRLISVSAQLSPEKIHQYNIHVLRESIENAGKRDGVPLDKIQHSICMTCNFKLECSTFLNQ